MQVFEWMSPRGRHGACECVPRTHTEDAMNKRLTIALAALLTACNLTPDKRKDAEKDDAPARSSRRDDDGPTTPAKKGADQPAPKGAAASETKPAGESPKGSPPKGEPNPRGAEPGSADSVLEVIEGHSRVEDTGFVHVLGEIRNKSDQWLEFVAVDLTLLDAEGKPINVDSVAAADGRGEGVYSERDFVPPGEVAIFHYIRDVKKLARPYASHRLVARARQGTDVYSSAIEDVVATRDDTSWTVRANVRATGSAGCKSPEAVIGLYAPDGKLWDTKSTSNDEWFLKIMPKGQAAPVSYPTIFDDQKKIATVKVWADCDHVDK
jgi:hypothetical protein